MSLATRIALLVVLLLGACGVAAGWAFHGALRRSAEAELSGRLDARLGWLEGALDLDWDEWELELEVRTAPGFAAEGWEVRTEDGRVLWSSSPEPGPAGAVRRDRRLTLGSANGPLLRGEDLIGVDDADKVEERLSITGNRPGWLTVPLDDVPPAARRAAGEAVPGIAFRDAFRKRQPAQAAAPGTPPDAPAGAGRPTVYSLAGEAHGAMYDVRVDADGRVVLVADRQVTGFGEYDISATVSDASRLPVVLTAETSAAGVDAEMVRVRRLLWTLGPLALLATGVVLTLLIRWQLRPLVRLARQATRVGPDNVGEPLPAAGGGGVELEQVRQAINAMLARLADALGRERRFASTAAHELRTPLAQMRLTLDVALRRPRGAGEYREALEEVSSDVDRLHRLVLGLLNLTRGAGAAPPPGRPVPLGPLLRQSADRRGPASLGPSAARADALIVGDEDLLCAAIGNVLENASIYAPGTPPAVDVDTAAGGDAMVEVTVRDDGPGVPAADRERVFEPLTRLDPSAPSDAGASVGLGLGLAAARAAARAFGGDLVCRARGDGRPGAEFRFSFRRADANADPGRPADPGTGGSPGLADPSAVPADY